MPKESLHWCAKLYRLDPGNFPDAIVYRCFVPSVCATPEEASRFRRRMLRGLCALKRQGFNSMETFRGLWQIPSFSLAYQDVNNRRLLENQAAVFRHAYQPFIAKVSALPDPAPLPRKGKVRIAFISEFFRTHTNSLAFEGLIKHLDKERFHTILLHNYDSIRDATRDRIDSYGHEGIVLPKRLDLATEMIRKLDLDVLFYPDIGMSPSLYVLALTRLAPLQVATWGIPHTSGIDTIDVYISTSLAEPASAALHYSEELCLVSRMPCCYLRDNLPIHTLSRSYFFLPEGVFIFACLQQLHKLHPDFDELLEELALRNPQALFVFAEHNRPLLTYRVLERWKSRAPKMLEKSRLLAHMDRKEFAALCGCVDLLLDPPYYGSGITFYESAHTGTPTLSLQGRFLRSRFVAGAYRMLGLDDPPVANNPSDYVALGSELAGDANRLRALKTSLAERADRHLYDDKIYVRQVEDIILAKMQS
jgi:predicted O-linked N-acetylglucosamine transferase (SPINDLY family)